VPRYLLTPRARDGLRATLEYVTQRFGARVAEEILENFVIAFDRLAENPGIGHHREELTRDEEIRFWTVGPSLLAYRQRPGLPLEILFVERAERDWSRLFLPEEGE
jgi:plasmid stabilization system protein ParE